MTVQKKIKEYLKKEEAFVPRYKHQMGEHPQVRHGNRGTVHQETPGGRAVGGVVTIGMNEETYAGGQFLPSTTLRKMAGAKRKVDTKYATEEERYLNTKQQTEPYVWEKPPSTDSRPISMILSSTTIPLLSGKKFGYDIEKARKTVPNPVATYSGYRQRTPAEWEEMINLAIKFNNGERWTGGMDKIRATRRQSEMIRELQKTGASQEEINQFLSGS